MENEDESNSGKWIGAVIIVIILIFVFNSGGKNKDISSSRYSGSTRTVSKDKEISRDDAISDYWDEIKDYVDGTETVNVCSSESGNCYDLDVDISSGVIEEMYFRNGGYLYFSADIDENGEASDYDQDGNEWDFSVDMDSSFIDDAISEWSSDNEYTID